MSPHTSHSISNHILLPQQSGDSQSNPSSTDQVPAERDEQDNQMVSPVLSSVQGQSSRCSLPIDKYERDGVIQLPPLQKTSAAIFLRNAFAPSGSSISIAPIQPAPYGQNAGRAPNIRWRPTHIPWPEATTPASIVTFTPTGSEMTGIPISAAMSPSVPLAGASDQLPLELCCLYGVNRYGPIIIRCSWLGYNARNLYSAGRCSIMSLTRGQLLNIVAMALANYQECVIVSVNRVSQKKKGNSLSIWLCYPAIQNDRETVSSGYEAWQIADPARGKAGIDASQLVITRVMYNPVQMVWYPEVLAPTEF